jgi:hypothetical protein
MSKLGVSSVCRRSRSMLARIVAAYRSDARLSRNRARRSCRRGCEKAENGEHDRPGGVHGQDRSRKRPTSILVTDVSWPAVVIALIRLATLGSAAQVLSTRPHDSEPP